jgi:hypothetical protein
MGNGALPHGPSYRAHPRLYRPLSAKWTSTGALGRAFCGVVMMLAVRLVRPHVIAAVYLKRMALEGGTKTRAAQTSFDRSEGKRQGRSANSAGFAS